MSLLDEVVPLQIGRVNGMPPGTPRKSAKAAKKSTKKVAKRPTKSPAKKTGAKKTGARAGDWREATLGRLRKLIKEADPGIVEEVKWRKPSNPGGVPTWTHAGIVCTGETYKDKVKLTFMKGASLPDPARLFNSSTGGGTRRAIDIHEGDTINASAFKALIKAAVALNEPRTKKR